MFGCNPFGGGFNPLAAFENFKADSVLGMAMHAAGPMAMANPTIALASQLAARADSEQACGSPFADLLADTQNLLGAMSNPADGLGWSPASAAQLLGRIGQAVASGGLNPVDAGLLGRAANVIGGNLQQQPGGELDLFGGALAPQQPFGAGGQGGHPFLSFLAGFAAQGFGQGPF